MIYHPTYIVKNVPSKLQTLIILFYILFFEFYQNFPFPATFHIWSDYSKVVSSQTTNITSVFKIFSQYNSLQKWNGILYAKCNKHGHCLSGAPNGDAVFFFLITCSLFIRWQSCFPCRRSTRSSAGSHQNSIAIADDFRLVDAGDWETEISREWMASVAPLTDTAGHQTSNKPPGLTQEALSCLHVEVFCLPENSDEQGVSRASRECSICLESFLKGDELINLPCGHRYHFCCLDPWVRICGDCPYCRTSIRVAVEGAKENRENWAVCKIFFSVISWFCWVWSYFAFFVNFDKLELEHV